MPIGRNLLKPHLPHIHERKPTKISSPIDATTKLNKNSISFRPLGKKSTKTSFL